MSAEHKKPILAFVLLVLLAAAVVGVQMRADAFRSRLFAAGPAGVGAHGTVDTLLPSERPGVADAPEVLDKPFRPERRPEPAAVTHAALRAGSETADLRRRLAPEKNERSRSPSRRDIAARTHGEHGMHGRVGGDRVLARLSGHENRLAREDAVSRRTDEVDASVRVATVRALETRGRSGGSLPWSLRLASQPGSIRHLVRYPAAAHGVEPTETVIASRAGEPSASLHEPAQATSSSGTPVGGH